MRISKEPEVRKREIADTAMKLFSEKGYEATSMKDIAREVNVVAGLCYNYFKSKHDLYQFAINLYAEECITPLISVFQKEEESIDIYLQNMIDIFVNNDGKEKYHEFFHREGNQLFHKQLEIVMNEKLQPYLEEFIFRMNNRGVLHVEDPSFISKFIVYGQSPIINDESISAEDKANKIINIVKILLK